MPAQTVDDRLRALIDKYDEQLQDDGDRQYMLEELLDELRALVNRPTL